MAAAEATLTRSSPTTSTSASRRPTARLLDGCQAIVDSYGLPAYTEGLGAKGCVVFSPRADA